MQASGRQSLVQPTYHTLELTLGKSLANVVKTAEFAGSSVRHISRRTLYLMSRQSTPPMVMGMRWSAFIMSKAVMRLLPESTATSASGHCPCVNARALLVP